MNINPNQPHGKISRRNALKAVATATAGAATGAAIAVPAASADDPLVKLWIDRQRLMAREKQLQAAYDALVADNPWLKETEPIYNPALAWYFQLSSIIQGLEFGITSKYANPKDAARHLRHLRRYEKAMVDLNKRRTAVGATELEVLQDQAIERIRAIDCEAMATTPTTAVGTAAKMRIIEQREEEKLFKSQWPGLSPYDSHAKGKLKKREAAEKLAALVREGDALVRTGRIGRVS